MKIFKKLNNISIVYKLSGIISLLVMISMLFVGIFTYTSNKTAIIDRTYEQLTSVRFEKTQRLVSFKNNKLLEVYQFANSLQTETIIKSILDYPKENLPGFNEDFSTISDEYFIKKGSVERLIFYDKSEFVVIDPYDSVENIYTLIFTKLEGFINNRPISNTPFVSDLMENDRGEVVFYIFLHLENLSEGAFIGFEISSKQINDIMLEDNPYNGLGASGEVYLAGTDGLMRSQSRFIDETVLKLRVPNSMIAEIKPDLAGNNSVNDYRGIKVLSSYGTMSWGDNLWIIFAEIDYAEALIPVNAFRDSIIFLGLVGAFMFSALIMFLAVTITRPIAKLNSAAVEISKGNYKIDLPVKNQDEIGKLSSTFNLMAGKIDEQSKRLEEQRKSRLQEMIDWQENERRRLSRELHDGIGQLLLSAKFRMGRISGKTENDKTIIDETQGIIQQAVHDVRDISNDLMPSVLNEFGLITGIKNLCEQIRVDYKADVNFVTNIESLPKDKVSTYIYRIVQEVFSNIIKHANASKIDISLFDHGKYTELIVSDDGQGFDANNVSELRGNGLRNISERVNLLNGNCKISSEKGKGTVIKILIPKTNQA